MHLAELNICRLLHPQAELWKTARCA